MSLFGGTMAENGNKEKAKLRYEGMRVKTLSGCCTVTEYIDSHNVYVTFEDGTKVKTNVSQIRQASIKNPNLPVVQGLGFIGIGPYSHKKDKQAYKKWYAMFERCYNENYHKTKPTYIGCSVVEDWYSFQNFAEWFYQQKRQDGWELDKDLLMPGNKVYGPDFCCLVPRALNLLINHNKMGNQENPIGVSFSKKRGMYYSAYHNENGENIVLGFSHDRDKLLQLYRNAKKGAIRKAAEKYKDVIEKRLYESLINWEV